MNVINGDGDPERPTEITPLLDASPNVSSAQPLPPVHPTLERVQDLDLQEFRLPHALPTRAAETAFALIILLQWRLNRLRQNAYTPDIWERWSKERDGARVAEDLEHHLLRLWAEFLEEYRSPQDIEDILWLEFPDREASLRVVRVVDFIADVDAPAGLLSHPIIYLSLLRTWKYGFFITQTSESSIRPRKITRFDSVCTPRVLHAIELLFQLGYLAILVHFLLYPPTRPNITDEIADKDLRGFLLMTFAAASLARSWSIFTIPSLLVFAAFSSCMPSVPSPGDLAFTILLIALGLHTLQLHLPHGPTPIFLLPFESCLPLCALLSTCVSRILLPILMLFLPVLFLTWSLVYLSLKDTFFRIPVLRALPAPVETRIGFFTILLIEVILLIPSLLTPLIMVPSLSPKNNSSNYWDRYSETIGLDARKAFVRAVLACSTPYIFPPPFNLLQALFQLLSAALRIHGAPSAFLGAVERMLWRIAVAPVAIVVAGFWMWGIF